MLTQFDTSLRGRGHGVFTLVTSVSHDPEPSFFHAVSLATSFTNIFPGHFLNPRLDRLQSWRNVGIDPVDGQGRRFTRTGTSILTRQQRFRSPWASRSMTVMSDNESLELPTNRSVDPRRTRPDEWELSAISKVIESLPIGCVHIYLTFRSITDFLQIFQL